MIPFSHGRNFSLIIFILFIAILVSSSSMEARSSTICDRSCPSGNGKSPNTVPFPFGFSDGCEIRLNCSSFGETKIGEFVVQNFTASSVFVNLSAKCDRPIESIKPLFGRNYGLTWENSLLLHDCESKKLNGCLVPMSVVEKRLRLEDNCSTSASNKNDSSLNCFSQDSAAAADIMDFAEVNNTSCKSLFTSIAVNSGGDSPYSLEFQRLELGWWLNGLCRNKRAEFCHANATCANVTLPGGKLGFRCYCPKDFNGDGFARSRGGSGCWKDSDCNPRKYLSGKCGGMSKVVVLVIGIISGAVLMAFLTCLCHFVRHRSTCLKNRMSAKRLLSEAAGTSSVALYPYKEIEKATNGFSESQRLGTGAFGMVYAGKLHNDEWVAIKKIKHRDNDGIDQVLNEIKLLSSVSHPNLVRLLGCCIEQGEQILIYEYMANGTLSQHLQRQRGRGLPWTTRLTIAAETANAIAYLHSAVHPPIYHRDIKSSNILLDFNFKSKVADFGLSRLGMTELSHISTAPQGTPGYVDPQYHQNFHLSDKSDVYSFGVVLVEIITSLKVVDFNRPQSEVNLAALAVDRIGKGCVDDIIDPFIEPHRDAWTLYSVNKVAELAFRCLAFHSDTRPSMMEVAEELEQIRRSGWATLEENIFASSVVSSCSSPYNGSESLGSTVSKKAGIGSQRLIVPPRIDDSLASMEEEQESSPVSVQEPWFSEQSSPSTNSLLGNVVR
ncbi:wall-associated receptor kinase-like 14 [Morus notabilis]|uniref:wall-associated receptor kinase-like 14 n=1 Tax=Morus notabilis TaxID=981085 RepID=UPI000CED4280|nr:wall-associated receptor kinase-like 14 [Morus notabilis]XP_024031023.1 wall-associated receptor kinase-like 14 [Morus notabilis]